MPYTIRPRRLGVLVAAVFASGILMAAAPVGALAACPSSSTSHPLQAFGDDAAYALLTGSSFESGAPGWSLSEAAVAKGSWSDGSTHGSHSLAIQPHGVAVSPSFCVSTAEPSFRFFLRQTSGSWGVLNVILRWTEASGATNNTEIAALQTGTTWTLSPVLQLATTLPLWQAGSTLSARLVFKPEPYGGAWAIDDVYIDPYSR